KGRNIREKIKSPFRYMGFDAGNILQQSQDQIPSSAVGSGHFLCGALVPNNSCKGGPLGYSGSSGGKLPLDFLTGFGNKQRGTDITNPPTRHGVSFGKAVNGYCSFKHPGK